MKILKIKLYGLIVVLTTLLFGISSLAMASDELSNKDALAKATDEVHSKVGEFPDKFTIFVEKENEGLLGISFALRGNENKVGGTIKITIDKATGEIVKREVFP